MVYVKSIGCKSLTNSKMNFIKNIICIGLLILYINPAKSQHTMGKVSGKNENGVLESLTGASVYWQLTTIGTLTDSAGYFHIANPENTPSKLIVSLVGYVSDTLTIDKPNQMDLKIVLKNMITL